MFPATTTRVPRHTAEYVNEEIHRQTEAHIARTAEAGPAAIERRLLELEHEWDIERCLETGASSFVLLGLGLGKWVNRKWFLLSAGVAAFLLQHAIQGWCPPVAIFRRLGVRTATEIDHERYALKILRGDFQRLPTSTDGDSRAAIGPIVEAVRS